MAQVHQAAVSEMLRLHFINVADGDATLVEQIGAGRAFRMLVDAGREDVGAAEGSLRCTAAAYLRALGVGRLDALVVTHLHVDHFFGLGEILDSVAVDDVWSGYFPEPGQRIMVDPEAVKTVRGMQQCLCRWAELTDRMRAAGTRLHPVERDASLALTDALRADIACPEAAAGDWQRYAWREMMAGGPLGEGLRYWAAKFRNPGSLRLRLAYAGRTVELAGDCYGAAWEDRARPCDILKVPHHGDIKSVTPALAERLHPAWAVVSCGAEYNPKKDRPSRTAAELLTGQGAQVLFTDCFAAPWRAPRYQRAILFTILDDGTIQGPAKP